MCMYKCRIVHMNVIDIDMYTFSCACASCMDKLQMYWFAISMVIHSSVFMQLLTCYNEITRYERKKLDVTTYES